jgi:hypothetical protein
MPKRSRVIRLIVAIISVAAALIGAGYTTFAYAENTRYRNSDLMGAASRFDLMWLITTIPATLAIMLLFNLFWPWAPVIFLVWSIGVGMSYKILLSHLLEFIRSKRKWSDDAVESTNKHRDR